MECPRCNSDSKPTGKIWKFGPFDGESHLCLKCKKQFNVYFNKGKFNHTIPKKKNNYP